MKDKNNYSEIIKDGFTEYFGNLEKEIMILKKKVRLLEKNYYKKNKNGKSCD